MTVVKFVTGESFCSHCREAIKILKEAYPQLKSKNVKIVQYDVRARKPEAIKALREKYDITWEIEPVTADFIKTLKKKYETLSVPLLEISGKRVPFPYDPDRLLKTILNFDSS